MRIDGIHVDGFGVWHDRRWNGLSAGMNVFHGPNEAGKTTLMSFIRAVLFGFERRNHPRRYEPLDGGNHGGALDVVRGGERVRIERTPGRHVRGAVRVHRETGETGDESTLEEMLAGTTRTLYHNVFAFGLEELEQFRTLEEQEVASHITGAGMGIGASRWSTVWKDVEDRRRRLFLPRGQNAAVNQALRELEGVRDELERTEAEPREYLEAHERRAGLDAEIRDLETRVAGQRRRVALYEKLREAEPHRKRRAQLEAELGSLEPVERFPEGGVERLNMLVHQRIQIQAEMDAEGSASQRLRTARAEMVAGYSPQELIRRERVVEALRIDLPRFEAARERVASTTEAHEAVRAEYAAAVARRDAERPPAPAVTIAFSMAVAVAAAALFLVGNTIPSLVVSFALPAIAFWYYRRMRRAAIVDAELGRISARLESAAVAARRAVEEERGIRSRLCRWTGKEQFSRADIETQAARVRELNEKADRIRSIDESLAGEERQRKRTETRAAELDDAVRKLLAEADAVSESDFLRRGDVFRRRRTLLEELARVPSVDLSQGGNAPGDGIDDGGATAGGRAPDDETLRAAVEELAAIVQTLEAARTEVGRLEERIRRLSRSDERSRARARQEAILARVNAASENWAVLTLCQTLLDETRRVYETERQPEVFRHASAFLARMSAGRWVRIISPLASEGLVVESASGERVSPENLSRGTAEQLYLAMRLALVREYSNHVEPLPVIFDDIFVNFDVDRTRRAIESVRDLARTHQVLLFTCHPHLVDLVGSLVPETAVHSLR